jgi:hypothetical protein
MKIESNANEIKIYGNIKSLSDYEKISSELSAITQSHKSIMIHLLDSISITSSVLGYLNKLALKDGINIRIYVSNDELYNLFEDLNFKTIFNVQKV